MNYYVSEIQIDHGVQFTAGIKARDDIETILNGEGYKKIIIENHQEQRKMSGIFNKVLFHLKIKKQWDNKLNNLKNGDMVLIQFPVMHHSLLLCKCIAKLKKRGIMTVLLIHDLEIFRAALRQDNSIKKKIRIDLEEKSLLELCDYMIVHNEKMMKKLIVMGFDEAKMVNLQIFDYLIPDYEKKSFSNLHLAEKPIVIAGALRKHKAKYAYSLPLEPEYNLYGVGYEAERQDNVHYFGAFPPDELPFVLNGSFGLVWDGNESETCTGVYGEYLKINNPHKTSLYLASGLPVIIWSEAALADFIKKNECGIVVDSLQEIAIKVKELKREEYLRLLDNVKEISIKMRNGYYTKNALASFHR